MQNLAARFQILTARYRLNAETEGHSLRYGTEGSTYCCVNENKVMCTWLFYVAVDTVSDRYEVGAARAFSEARPEKGEAADVTAGTYSQEVAQKSRGC